MVEVRSPLPWTMALCRSPGVSVQPPVAAPGCARAQATLAIVASGSLGAAVMHTMGWAQLAHFAEVRALASGRADDRPLALGDRGRCLDRRPLLLGQVARDGGDLHPALHADRRHRRQASSPPTPPTRPRGPTEPRWVPNDGPPYASYGYDAARAQRVEVADRGRDSRRLGPDAVRGGRARRCCLLLLRPPRRRPPRAGLRDGRRDHARPRDDPDGLRRRVLLARDLDDARVRGLRRALIRERPGRPERWLVARRRPARRPGGQLRVPDRPRRGGAVLLRDRPPRPGCGARSYAGGALVGALPALAFNAWALGSPLKLAYSHAVAVIGTSGHASLGLNSDGFFGITLPRLGRRARSAARRPWPAGPDAGRGHGRDRGRADAAPRTPRRGLDDPGVAIAYFLYNSATGSPTAAARRGRAS